MPSVLNTIVSYHLAVSGRRVSLVPVTPSQLSAEGWNGRHGTSVNLEDFPWLRGFVTAPATSCSAETGAAGARQVLNQWSGQVAAETSFVPMALQLWQLFCCFWDILVIQVPL